MVEPKHVALQSISENNEGRLVFYMYIQLEQEIIKLEDIENGLQVNKSLTLHILHVLITMMCDMHRHREMNKFLSMV